MTDKVTEAGKSSPKGVTEVGTVMSYNWKSLGQGCSIQLRTTQQIIIVCLALDVVLSARTTRGLKYRTQDIPIFKQYFKLHF